MTSIAEDRARLHRSAARASCRVEWAEERETETGPRLVGRVVCADGWGAFRMLVSEAEEDAQRPDVQQIALMLRVAAPDDAAFARAVHDYVRRGVRFVREKGEVFTSTTTTLAMGYGDCDDHARAVYAIALAGGLATRMAGLHKPFATGPSHAVTQLGVDGMWWWAETTVPAWFGEQPYDAARRLGLLSEREDIAKEVRTMSDKDLPPLPRTVTSSSAADVQRDAQALARLGFICDEAAAAVDSPANEAFRQAVAAFQAKHGGLVVDGAIGPKTRGAIAGQLVPDEFGMGYLAAIGGTGRTAHLSSEFFGNVERMAQHFRDLGANVTALDFLNVWLSESGIGRAKHGHGGLDYHGLNMMMGSNLPGLGWTAGGHAFGEADPADQIAYVQRFYEQMTRAFLANDYAKLDGASTLYLINFLPAYAKHGGEPDYVLTRKGDRSGWYEDNPVFDPEHKGWIEVADMGRQLERVKAQNAAYWAEVEARALAEGGTAPPGAGGVSGVAGLVAGAAVVLVAAGIFAAVLTHAGDRAATRAELRSRARAVAALPGRALAAVRR